MAVDDARSCWHVCRTVQRKWTTKGRNFVKTLFVPVINLTRNNSSSTVDPREKERAEIRRDIGGSSAGIRAQQQPSARDWVIAIVTGDPRTDSDPVTQ